jgi:hypothetical protein
MRDQFKQGDIIFKVGDIIRIKTRPYTWSSYLNDNYPLNNPFPMIIKIETIFGDSMACKNFGWDVAGIIDAGFEIIEDNKEINYEIY